jgi:hypothetical protein
MVTASSVGNLGSSAWRMLATSDMNRDRFSDLIWNDETTRNIAIWYTGGAAGGVVAGTRIVGLGAEGWQLTLAADMNGDGTPDLIFRKRDSVELAYWYMGGADGLGASVINTASGPLGANRDWDLKSAVRVNSQ